MRGVYYDPLTGAVLQTFSAPKPEEGQAYLEHPDPQPEWARTKRVIAGELMDCPAIEPSWDLETQVLSGLPDPCVVQFVDEAPVEVLGGAVMLEAPVGGVYTVKVRAPGWLPYVGEVNT